MSFACLFPQIVIWSNFSILQFAIKEVLVLSFNVKKDKTFDEMCMKRIDICFAYNFLWSMICKYDIIHS